LGFAHFLGDDGVDGLPVEDVAFKFDVDDIVLFLLLFLLFLDGVGHLPYHLFHRPYFLGQFQVETFGAYVVEFDYFEQA
jgi:hypothetical protein